MSFDPPSATKPWVIQEKFPFEVWTDSDRTLAKALGSEGKLGYAARKSYLIDANGTVLLEYGGVDVSTHPEDVLEDAKKVLH
jgi:peroxiredoxin